MEKAGLAEFLLVAPGEGVEPSSGYLEYPIRPLDDPGLQLINSFLKLGGI